MPASTHAEAIVLILHIQKYTTSFSTGSGLVTYKNFFLLFTLISLEMRASAGNRGVVV